MKTTEFLSILQQGGAFGYYWTTPAKRSTWWPADAPAPVPHALDTNVYFGVHPSVEIPRTNRQGRSVTPEQVRSRIDTIAAINHIFAEFDLKDFAHMDALWQTVDTLTPPPSIVVASGGGAHCYWLLRETLLITDDATRAQCVQFQADWVRAMGGDPAAKDLARVLRVPGTRNYKYADAPEVTIVRADPARRYTLDELAYFLPAADEPPAPALHPRPTGGTFHEQYAQQQLERAVERTRLAPDGVKHDVLLHMARWLGGFVPHGLLTETAIAEALYAAIASRAADKKGAQATIRDGIGYGRAMPLDLPEPPQEPLFDDDGQAYCPTHQTPLIAAKNGNGWRCTVYDCFWWKGDGYVPPPTPAAPPLTTPPTPAAPDPTLAHLPATDAGNAEAFVALWGEYFRYVHDRKKWLVWQDTRWALDTDGAADRAMLATARARRQAAAAIPDADAAQKAFKWALSSESTAKRAAALTTAQVLPPLKSVWATYDRHPLLATVQNGTLDLVAGTIRPSDPADNLTMQLGTVFDPDATCPRWEQFLAEIFGGDQELIGYVQRAVGYALTGDTREQKLFLCYGGGANGKSTFLDTLHALLGDYAGTTSFDTFDASRRTENTNDLAALSGKRFVTAIESDDDRVMAEARVKAITGQDPITCRFLYGEFFTYYPQFKLWLAMNHKPTIRGTDHGIWRRIQLIPFEQSFEGRAADPLLGETLRTELPGILRWALQGLAAWLRQGLGSAASIDRATTAYREESDLVAQWIADCVEQEPYGMLPTADALASYSAWCRTNGYRQPTARALGRRLGELGYDSARTNRARFHLGLRLTAEEQERLVNRFS